MTLVSGPSGSRIWSLKFFRLLLAPVNRRLEHAGEGSYRFGGGKASCWNVNRQLW